MIRSRLRLRGGGGGAPSAFSPTAIAGLQLWLDASDAATITQSAGAVSQWNDKSGNGNHATQGTGSLQPVTGENTINSLNTILSDGIDDTMVLPSALYTISSGDNTVFGVFSKTTTGMSLARPIAGANGTLRWGIYGDTVNGGIGFINRTNGSAHPTDPWSNSTIPVLFVGSRNGTLLSAGVGGAALTTANTAETFTMTSAALFNTTGFGGQFGETLVWNRDLSTTEKNQVGNYLAAKWGISWTNI